MSPISRLKAKRRGRRRNRGMTLIEIMVVVTILGLIAASVGVAVFKQLASAKVKTTCNQLKTIEEALDLYKLDHGDYPSTDQGLSALIAEGQLKGNSVPKDGWEREFIYVFPGQHGDYDLYSMGEDGREGGETDPNSWGPPCTR